MKTRRHSRSVLNLETSWWWEVSSTTRPLDSGERSSSVLHKRYFCCWEEI